MRTVSLLTIKAIVLIGLASCGGGGGGGGSEQLFTVTIQNTASSLLPDSQPLILSTAILAVHTEPSPLLTVGEFAGNTGLEAFAEAANNSTLIQTLQSSSGVNLVGIAQTPVGSQSAAFLAPGQSYAVTISASPGEMVSLALSFVQANDTLVANANAGSSLFDANGAAISGEVPMALFDVGTEVDEPIATGPNQVLRQDTDTSGEQENNPIAIQTGSGFPAASSFIRVSFTPAG